MKVVLVWRDIKNHKRSFIASFVTKEQAFASIWAWWAKHNYKPTHTRTHEQQCFINGENITRIVVDYGPHTMFYELWFVSDDFELPFVELNIQTKKMNGVDYYKFVGCVADELIPGCFNIDSGMQICGIGCKRDKWYTLAHYKTVMTAISSAIKKASADFYQRESQTMHLLYEENSTPTSKQLAFNVEGELIQPAS